MRDISIYGQIDVANPSTDQYRTVELIAYSLFDQFHRKRPAIAAKNLPKGWSVIQIWATGPKPAPTDDDMTVARVVTLQIELLRVF